MCGRFVLGSMPEVLRAAFGYGERPNFPPRFNIAPTQPIAVVREDRGTREFVLMRWGLIPSWVKDPRTFSLLINARGETLLDKPAFRNAIRRRRCLVPADGFFEWKAEGKTKRPFFIRRRDRAPFAFAGIWEAWMGPNGEELETACIVTTRANATLAALHDRMPVIVPEAAFARWLDCAGEDPRDALELVVPAPDDLLEAYEVSTAVNRTANDSPDLLAPLGPMPSPETPPAAATAARRPRPKRESKREEPSSSGQGSLF